ncbi:MAG: hypothetical protein DMF95_17665 [Acidobacteria bacterium]|nr:MAG: hypothetical protein DMF94_25100 [Acidobacteriota bacterium]PYR46830.1 MAG: hypothetical protein DMF95_17665 [Acidobacteriota bacterium]
MIRASRSDTDTSDRNWPSCDVQFGDYGAQYNMQAKYAKLKNGGPNPFIDPASCKPEANISEAMFHAILAEQQKAKQP